MCAGAALLHRIPRVIISENRNFQGAKSLFSEHGIDVAVFADPCCIKMMRCFIAEHPTLWNEDIGRD